MLLNLFDPWKNRSKINRKLLQPRCFENNTFWSIYHFVGTSWNGSQYQAKKTRQLKIIALEISSNKKENGQESL